MSNICPQAKMTSVKFTTIDILEMLLYPRPAHFTRGLTIDDSYVVTHHAKLMQMVSLKKERPHCVSSLADILMYMRDTLYEIEFASKIDQPWMCEHLQSVSSNVLTTILQSSDT